MAMNSYCYEITLESTGQKNQEDLPKMTTTELGIKNMGSEAGQKS